MGIKPNFLIFRANFNSLKERDKHFESENHMKKVNNPTLMKDAMIASQTELTSKIVKENLDSMDKKLKDIQNRCKES